MSERPEVVVVDGLRETTEVLQAILEPRGLRVSRRSSCPLPGDSESGRPRVLVLHEDLARDSAGPRVIVGRLGTGNGSCTLHGRALSQPFHYSELIAAIKAAVETPHD